MQKTINLKSVDVKRVGNKKIYRIDIQGNEINDWCLHLSLLNYDLLERLIIVCDNVSLILCKIKNKKKRKIKYNSVTVSNGAEVVGVTEGELSSWIEFYLRYYRDSIGEVDHIDTQIYRIPEQLDYEELYITVTVPKMREIHATPKSLSNTR